MNHCMRFFECLHKKPLNKQNLTVLTWTCHFWHELVTFDIKQTKLELDHDLYNMTHIKWLIFYDSCQMSHWEKNFLEFNSTPIMSSDSYLPFMGHRRWVINYESSITSHKFIKSIKVYIWINCERIFRWNIFVYKVVSLKLLLLTHTLHRSRDLQGRP